MKNWLISGLSLLLWITSCKKEEYVNPYTVAGYNNGNGNVTTPNLDPNSISGIHARILKPTCANSGCHDGTFEPDFRTVESSYNTLVYHPIIKNNPQGVYTYRVIPGNIQLSQFYKRMIEDIDGQSGIMPLSLEPDSDWEEKKQEYIANIYNWIQQGAKDIFGNSPQQVGAPIQLAGMVATLSGSTAPLPRSADNNAILIPSGVTNVNLWFSLLQGNTSVQNLSLSEILISSQLNGFQNIQARPLNSVNGQNWIGFTGSSQIFAYNVSIDISNLTPGIYYTRVQVVGQGNDQIIQMPNDGSLSHVKQYYAFQVN
jgi:hypothetical protein